MVKGIRERRKKTNARREKARIYILHICIANDPSRKSFFRSKWKQKMDECILIFVIDFLRKVDSRIHVQKF